MQMPRFSLVKKIAYSLNYLKENRFIVLRSVFFWLNYKLYATINLIHLCIDFNELKIKIRTKSIVIWSILSLLNGSFQRGTIAVKNVTRTLKSSHRSIRINSIALIAIAACHPAFLTMCAHMRLARLFGSVCPGDLMVLDREEKKNKLI